MQLQTELYQVQKEIWPQSGRHILAQFDETSVVVYQAYRPAIGHFAARHGYFGGEFSLSRMSWIKPNFLWMMYRNGWGTKAGQEVTLAVWLKREAFDTILAQAVPSSHQPQIYQSKEAWQQAVDSSSVHLQWDPDHDPWGQKLERRALQLGLRQEMLANYAREWLVEIEDISDFVQEQRKYNLIPPYPQLLTPRERVYPVANGLVAARLGIPLDGKAFS